MFQHSFKLVVTRTQLQCCLFCLCWFCLFFNLFISLSSEGNGHDNFSVTQCNSACTRSPDNEFAIVLMTNF